MPQSNAPKTYEQGFNDLQQAINSSNFYHRKEEMILNDKPFYSHNDIEKMKEKWFMYGLIAVVATGILVVMIMRYWK